MVSKLHLAVQEVCIKAIEDKEDPKVIDALVAHYEEIGYGIGVHKSPDVYGAFPTDPYSHTPQHRGAQQPGMTGQVKEDVLIRISELGVILSNGKLQFKPTLLKRNEFLTQNQEVVFVAVDGSQNTISLPENSLAFTYCQVPVIYKIAKVNMINLSCKNGDTLVVNSLGLNAEQSAKIFNRTEEIVQIEISITEDNLR
jgi:hypothetical protein